MAEEERLIEWRVAKVEVDVKDIKTEITAMRECQIKTNGSMDNLLIGFGELRQAIDSLKGKPAKNWEKLISAIIGAGAVFLFGILEKFFGG